MLFRLIESLKRDGIAIVYVSHKLDELLSITDRITVLRDGRLVKTLPTGETNHDAIVRLMVGRQLSEMFVHTRDETAGRTASRQRPVAEIGHLQFPAGRRRIVLGRGG